MREKLFSKRKKLEVKDIFNLKQIYILASENVNTRFTIKVPESRFRNILAHYRAYKGLGKVEKWMLEYDKVIITKLNNNNIVELIKDVDLPEKNWFEEIIKADWYKLPMHNLRPLCV